MRKLFIVSMLVLLSVAAFSQQRTRSFFGWHLAKDAPAKLNEVKLNLGTTIFSLFPEITYEYILSEDLSLGASAGINLSDEYPLDFAITPYARWFFGGSSLNLQKYGTGFFIELNGSVFSHKYDYYDYGGNNFNAYNRKETGAGLGLALGWKYLSQNNWVGELHLGGGRDFVNDSGYPRIGLTLGKRF